jgi:hypothetical protein
MNRPMPARMSRSKNAKAKAQGSNQRMRGDGKTPTTGKMTAGQYTSKSTGTTRRK